MADQKSIGIAILGIAAVLAIIGLVLMFTTAIKSGAFSATLPKVYGGAIKDVDYPMLRDRTTSGVGGDEYTGQDNPQFMYYERGVRQIPTLQTTCPEGFARASYTQMLGFKQRGSDCFEHSASAYCCRIIGASGVI
ncbi:hypothetical protein JW851_04725 [Candidatus Woesearchaeota archaeon]|nr:hypothetical protein [Candidatus Woesearchaeota archaeon]